MSVNSIGVDWYFYWLHWFEKYICNCAQQQKVKTNNLKI